MDFQPVHPNHQPMAPTQPRPLAPMPPTAPPKRGGHKFLTFCLIVIIAAACAGGVYYWQHKKVTDANAQTATATSQAGSLKAQLSDQQSALAALPNIVQTTTGNTTDLAVFLGASNTGCYKQASDGKGFFKINKEFNDQSAEMQYGCQNTYATGTPNDILAVKANNQWSLISPTNQWSTVSGAQVPSCTMVNAHKISKQLEPKCVVDTSVTTPVVQDVTNP